LEHFFRERDAAKIPGQVTEERSFVTVNEVLKRGDIASLSVATQQNLIAGVCERLRQWLIRAVHCFRHLRIIALRF
jgi:hypothetical protein